MADVNTYSRCIMAHIRGATVYHVGDVRANTDPSVVQNPSYWQAYNDTTMVDDKKHEH